MDFIKKFFDGFKTPPEGKIEYTVRDVDFGESLWKITDDRLEDAAYFTQAEKNYLQRLIADKINEQEELREQVLGTAKYYKEVNGTHSKVCFKTHRALKADIKKLVALQKKIKHTLATRG